MKARKFKHQITNKLQIANNKQALNSKLKTQERNYFSYLNIFYFKICDLFRISNLIFDAYSRRMLPC